jgi:hypothetical protein
VSSEGTRITEDSESSAKWALSRCKECTEEYITTESSRRRHSTRWALRNCADRHKREENSFELWNLKKNPLKDLHKVTEHPKT